MPQLQKNPFSEVSADDINKTYRDGYITAAKKNELLRNKAKANIQESLGNDGMVMAVWKETVKQLQENWDTLKEISATPDKDITAINDAKNGARAAWAMINIALAPLNAVGEVTGQNVELLALQAGASVGLAKTLGIAANVGTGFVPVGGAMRQFAKGVQKLKKPAQAGAAVNAPGAVDPVVQAIDEIDQIGKIADDAIKQGMIADGVKEVAEKAVEQGGKAVQQIVGPPTAKEMFTKNLRTYRKELEAITETKSHATTLAEASKLGLNLDDLRGLVPGTALKEAEMAAYLKALDGPVDELIELSKGVLNGKVEGHRLGMAFQDFFEYSPKFRAAEVTAGRSVEILKETPPMKPLTDLMVHWDADAMAKMEPQAVWKTLAEDIVALADEPGKLKALQVQGAVDVAKTGWDKWWPRAREAYVNLLLARPITQVRNFIGNTAAAMTSAVEREIGGWLSISDKGLVRGEGVAQFQGMMAGLGDTFGQFSKAFKNIDDAGRLDFVPHQIPGVLGRIVNLPGDTMRGMDNVFKHSLARGDLYAQAMQQATHQGLKGTAFADYVTRRVTMPTAAMMDHARDFAMTQTFANDLGTIGNRIQKTLQTGPLALLFPFMKTPMNLVKYAWDRTPGLQFLSKSLYSDIIEGGTKADMAIGRLTLSNMMGMFVFGLAQEGLITGGGPADPTLRRSWMATRQPYSIAGKDGWYPFTNLDPATTPIALIADYAEIMNQLDDPTAEQGAMAIGLSITRDIVDKTWWQTMGDVLEIVSSARAGEQPSKSALQVVTGPATTVASGGPLVAGLARVEDPIRREARSLLDTWRARVPGYSATLPPMRDGWGDPILPPQPLGSPWLGLVSPVNLKQYEDDEVKKEGSRLQVRLPQFPSSIGGRMRDDFDVRAAMPGEQLPVELTPQQRDRWQVIYKNMVRHPETGIKAMLLDNEEYKNATFAAQREGYMDYLSSTRAAAKDALLIEDGELREKSTKATVGRYLPMLQQEQRAQAEAQTQEAIDMGDKLSPQGREELSKWGYLDTETPTASPQPAQ